MMEEFEKMGKQGAGIKELLKLLLDEVASNRSSLTKMEESMHELKMVADGSLKQIEEVEKRVEATLPPPPPSSTGSYPPPSGKVETGKSPPTTEKLLDPMAGDNHLHVETRNRGNGEGILSIPPRPPECSVSHSAPTTLLFVLIRCLRNILNLLIIPSRVTITQPTSTFLSLTSLSLMVKILRSGLENVRFTLRSFLFHHFCALDMLL
jgi:hypothetical protein